MNKWFSSQDEDIICCAFQERVRGVTTNFKKGNLEGANVMYCSNLYTNSEQGKYGGTKGKAKAAKIYKRTKMTRMNRHGL